jgi:hypothetical protein
MCSIISVLARSVMVLLRFYCPHARVINDILDSSLDLGFDVVLEVAVLHFLRFLYCLVSFRCLCLSRDLQARMSASSLISFFSVC